MASRKVWRACKIPQPAIFEHMCTTASLGTWLCLGGNFVLDKTGMTILGAAPCGIKHARNHRISLRYYLFMVILQVVRKWILTNTGDATMFNEHYQRMCQQIEEAALTFIAICDANETNKKQWKNTPSEIVMPVTDEIIRESVDLAVEYWRSGYAKLNASAMVGSTVDRYSYPEGVAPKRFDKIKNSHNSRK